jgi:hypothetical protein
VQAEHLRPTQFALLLWEFRRPGGSGFFFILDLVHVLSIRILRNASTGQIFQSGLRRFALPLETGRTATSCVAKGSKGSGERTHGSGEKFLGLTERGAESVREDAEGGEVLLELRDPDR